MASSRARSQLVLTDAMRSIIGRHDNPVMGTATFAENITDKKEATKRFRRVLERIRRHYKLQGVKVELAGAWQRQERGAWHPHFICSKPLPVDWLRALLVECGFGRQCRLDFIKPRNGFRHVGSRHAVSYIARYVTRDFSSTADAKGARLSFFFGVARGSCRGWSFAGGLSRLHRLGCKAWYGPEADWVNDLEMRHTGRLPSIYASPGEGLPVRWLTAFEQWRWLVRRGWDSLPQCQKDSMFATSPGVQWFLANEGLVEAPF